MTKEQQEQFRRRPPHKKNTVESAAVAIPGKSTKDSPLAGYQWRPGESGNPAGRPRTGDLKAAVREFADEADPKIRKTRLRVWLEIRDRRARQGSPKHLELLLGYGWGRPAQAMELTGGLDLTSTVEKARKRAEAPDVFLPASTRGIGDDAQTARAATATAEQGREDDDAEPAVIKGRVKRIVM